MSAGTVQGSITSSGQGTISSITIDLLSGAVTAQKDSNPGSGTISNASITTISSTGAINAGGAVTNLAITTIQGGNFNAGTFQTVTASNVTASTVKLVGADATRTLQLVAVPGFSKPAEFSFSYDGTGTGNPKVSVVVDDGGVSNARGDLSLLTDTVGKTGSGIDLVSLTANGQADLRNVVVAGNLTPAAGTLAVNLPQDTVAVEVAGNIPAGSIGVQGTPAVAFGSANGVAAASATLTGVAALFTSSTATARANDTFQAFTGAGVPVALYLVTNSSGSSFDNKSILFQDEGTNFIPVTAAVRVSAAGNSSTVQEIDLTGEGASFQTQQLVSQAITVTSGSLGDVTLQAPGGSPANITAPSIVGSINVTNGGISGTIQTTQGDLGRAIKDTSGNIIGVTSIQAGAGGLTSTGQIISAGNLVSLISLKSGLDGTIAAQGDIGVIQTDANGNAVVDSAGRLTRFGGVNVTTGGMSGSIVALGNVFGDISVGGGLAGRIAVKGRAVMGIDATRTGILGNVNINGGISATGAIISAGRIGDDAITDSTRFGTDGVGTTLNISGTTKGILAAEDDINFGSVGSLVPSLVFEHSTGTNKSTIDAIFTDGGTALTIPVGLTLILTDLDALTVGTDGNLTGTKP
jgi:hypothetical protein